MKRSMLGYCVGLLFMVIGVAGCATSPPMKPNYATSSIAFAKDIQDHQKGSATPPQVEGGVAGRSSSGTGFEDARYRWCGKSTDRGSAIFMAQVRFSELCTVRQGSMEGRVCVKPGDYEQVKFFADVTSDLTCADGTPVVDVLVIEPRQDLRWAPYVARLDRAGYPTTTERSERDARQQERTRVLDAEVARVMSNRHRKFETELSVMRKRGTTVCRTEGATLYRGWVEDFTDEKLRINISSAASVNAPALLIPGFQPQTFWDFPSNWHPCR